MIESCVTDVDTWNGRAKMSDAVWGGSANTSLSTQPYVSNHVARKGVPVEVAVELANQLDVNPWFNMPHAANDHYVRYFAEYVNEHLNSHLRAYIEYSNEFWNSGFVSFFYATLKAAELGLNTEHDEYIGSTNRGAEYFGRLRFYSRRSVEIFDIWEEAFGGKERLIRVMGVNQGDTIRTKEVLKFENAGANAKVDAIAIAPYFLGCTHRDFQCEHAPVIMQEISTVDDVFDAMDWEGAPSGIDGLLNNVKRQAVETSKYGAKVISYEGGQHFTTNADWASEFSLEE